MSFMLLMAAAAAIAASAGYLASRREGKTGEGKEGRAPAKPDAGPKKPSFDAFPLALGEVVLAGSDERWLAGALLLREDARPVAAVFLAPEGATHHAVVAFPPPRREILWLEPVEVASPDEPPATLEIRGLSLRRQGRLPVTVERLGQGAPALGASALFATYTGGARDVAVVLTSEGKTHAWVGRRLDEGEYDRLGAGDAPD